MNPEELTKFVEWTKVKIRIHFSSGAPLFRDGEIWWASLGANIGYEQDGKNVDFERPILVLRKFNKYILWAIPLSTKIKSNNPYYYQYELSGEKYSAILSQLRLISSKRLRRKIGMFPKDSYLEIRQKIKLLI